MKDPTTDDSDVNGQSKPEMELTSSFLKGLGIGDNVWVKQGKTEHMATFLGKPRKATAIELTEDKSGSESRLSNEDECEAMVRWTTTGTTSYAAASSIRSMMDGQRRRRQVVKHYDAVPSQRPGIRKKRKKTIKIPRDKQISEQLHSRNGGSGKAAKETSVTRPSSFPSELPEAEESEKFQEYTQNNTEKKQRRKTLIRKRKRVSTINSHAPVMNDAETSENDSKPSSVGATRGGISDSEGNDESKDNAPVLRANRKSDDDVEDPSLTIARGFRWEWETPESKDKPKESIPEQNISSKLVPKNFGKGKPRCWAEAYLMLLEFQRNNDEAGGTKCDISSDHPLLGNFVADIRAEYTRFRKRKMKQKRGNPVPNPDRNFDLNTSKDLTHVSHTRIRQLEKIGFRWKTDSKSYDHSFNAGDRVANDSDEESFDTSSLDEPSDRGLEEENIQRRSILSYSSSSSSSSSRNLSMVNFREDHANDDKLLIVRRLTEIHLACNTHINLQFVQAGKPTFPVQLYRLLRLSTLNPKLGLNKIIRWDDNESGFWILQNNPQLLMKEILSKISNWANADSFSHTLNLYYFSVVAHSTGRRSAGPRYRLFKHKSVIEAEEANDPSLRLFYRGAPLETIWKIKNKRDEKLGIEEAFARSGFGRTGKPFPTKIIPSSSAEDDATIIKASEAKILHHSSSVLRLLLNSKRRRSRKINKTQIFQARTKRNPSGIITSPINLSNWQKIENLKQRATQQRRTEISSTPAMANNAFGNEEALV